MTRAWVEVDLARVVPQRSRRRGARRRAAASDGEGRRATASARCASRSRSRSSRSVGLRRRDVTEGEELRRGGITRPIVVFTPILRTEIDALRRADLTPALGDPAVIESWARTGRAWHLADRHGDVARGNAVGRGRRSIASCSTRTRAGRGVHALSLGGARRRQPRRAGGALRRGAGAAARAARAGSRRERTGGGAARAVAVVALPARASSSTASRRARGEPARAGAGRLGARAHRRAAHHRRRRHGELRRDVARARCAADRHGPGGVRRRISTHPRQPRGRAAAAAAHSRRGTGDDGHDDARRDRHRCGARRRRHAARPRRRRRRSPCPSSPRWASCRRTSCSPGSASACRACYRDADDAEAAA